MKAIRPAGRNFKSPEKTGLAAQELQLYRLSLAENIGLSDE